MTRMGQLFKLLERAVAAYEQYVDDRRARDRQVAQVEARHLEILDRGQTFRVDATASQSIKHETPVSPRVEVDVDALKKSMAHVRDQLMDVRMTMQDMANPRSKP